MITVVSANLWHDWPRQQRRAERLESLCRIVESEAADVLLLQEVTRTRRSATDAWLAQRLDMEVAYARGSGHLGSIGFEEGLAVLSRFPLGGSVIRRLDRGPSALVRRMALAVELATPYGPMVAVSTHLGLLPSGNTRQLLLLADWVDSVAADHPAVVGGDLNAPEGRAGIIRLRERWTDTFRDRHPTADATTHAEPTGLLRRVRPRRLDYVFVREPKGQSWQVVAADHVHDADEPHSDHRAVLARLRPLAPQ